MEQKRKNRLTRILTISAASIAATSGAIFAAAPMIQFVPNNAILYVGLAGNLQQWPGYHGSNAQKLISGSPRLQKLLKMFEAPATAKGVMASSPFSIGYPLAMYLTSFKGMKDGNPVGNFGIVINAGRHWKHVLKEISDNTTNDNKLLPGEKRGHLGGLVYDIIQPTSNEMRLLKKGAGGSALTSNPQYRSLAARLGTMSANAWYVDMPKLSSDVLNGHYPSTISSSMALIRKVYKGVGLDNYTVIAGGGGFVGKNYVYHIDAGMVKEGNNDTAGLKQMLAMVPENAASVATYHFDLAAMYNTLVNIGKQAGFATMIQQGAKQAGTLAGISLRRDVIDALGGRWVDFSIPTATGSYATVTESILRHPNKVSNSLQAIAPLVLMAVNAERQQKNPNAEPISLTTTSVGKDTIYSIRGHGFVWCVAGKRLIIGSSIGAIKTQLNIRNTSIMDNPKFFAAYNKLAADHGLRDLAWVDSRKLIPESYLWLLKIFPQVDAAYPQAAVFLRASNMPKLSLLQQYLQFSNSAQWYTPHHWQLAIHSSLPEADLLTPQTGAFMTQLSNPLVGKILALSAVISFTDREAPHISAIQNHAQQQPAPVPAGAQQAKPNSH